MQQLVRLWKRPCKGGREFRYVLIWYDEDGRERWHTLGHADGRKAERQRAQKERELRMGLVGPRSMKLSEFLKDSVVRTRGQVRESTIREACIAMRHFIGVIGDIDYQKVSHKHGERFLQGSLDARNAPATAAKKLRHLKRVFQLALDRGQLEQNPLKRVRPPRIPRRSVHVFSEEECVRLIRAARQSEPRTAVKWELLIRMALCTGMRRGELLNLTWQDIDFERKTVEVAPKQNADYTWEWHIKDVDRRTLPLTEQLLRLLAQHHTEQPEAHPYVFVPAQRYERIQQCRKEGRWSVMQGCCPLNNLSDRFRTILRRAGIERGEFHDLRRTCLSGWLAQGLSEHDVMNLAGHSCFETTRRFYLAVRDDLVERARVASDRMACHDFIANSLQVASETPNEKGCQP